MSVYGNKITNNKSISDLNEEIKILIYESEGYNKIADQVISESSIINEFNLNLFKNKITKNKNITSKILDKMNQIKSKVSTKKKVESNNEIDEKLTRVIGPIFDYPVLIKESTKYYKQSRKNIEKIDNDLKKILSKSNNISENELKKIIHIFKKYDIYKIEHKKMDNKTLYAMIPSGGTTLDLWKEYDLATVLDNLVTNYPKICDDCLNEMRQIISSCNSINETILKYIDSVDKSEIKYLKDIQELSTKQLNMLEREGTATCEIIDMGMKQRDKLIEAFDMVKK